MVGAKTRSSQADFVRAIYPLNFTFNSPVNLPSKGEKHGKKRAKPLDSNRAATDQGSLIL